MVSLPYFCPVCTSRNPERVWRKVSNDLIDVEAVRLLGIYAQSAFYALQPQAAWGVVKLVIESIIFLTLKL